MSNLERDYGRADSRKLVYANATDLWICRYFKVLPTEQRFLALTDEQKHLLVSSFFEMPLDELAHRSYHDGKRIDISQNEAEHLKKAGYTGEQIEYMRRQLALASGG